MTKDFGKGFDEREMRRIRQFYSIFPIRYTLRTELSWTHYRLLLKVENSVPRGWYMNEAAQQQWSSRALERQINALYYERLLATREVDRPAIEQEALVFYNYMLRCFVLIDLKVGKLTHQDVGQMDMYVRMYEEQRKQPGDNSAVSLILCTEKNETVVKYSVLNDNQHLFASKYKLFLPTEEELKAEIERDKLIVEQNQLSS